MSLLLIFLDAMGSMHSKHDWRNRIGGYLFGSFAGGFITFMILVQYWAHCAPHAPAPLLGEIYPHNEHGSITYFTAFQATSAYIMFWLNMIMLLLAIGILPKRQIKVRSLGRFPVATQWQNDDDKGLAQSSAKWGASLVIPVIFLAGPPLVHALMRAGVVLNL